MRFPRRVIHDPARRCSTAVMLALVMVTCSIVSSFPVRTGQTPQTSIRRITWSYSALASHPQSSSSSSSLYRYRTAQESDLPGIAKLLDETFENDEIQVGDMSTSSTSTSSTTTTTKKSWWNLCKSNPKQSSNHYNNNNDDDQSTIHFRQLQRRWMDLVQNPNVPHTWIVAERLKRTTTTTTSTNAIAGFMELGTMPSPIPIPKTNSNTIESKEGNVNENQQFTTSSTKTWHGIEITSSSSSTYPTTESSTSSTSSRRPERPFLANLAVSFDHRRQGIGKKLVQLAMKISKKWKEDNKNDNDNNKDDNGNSTWSMYLSVDKDNHAAVQLYQQLHFTIVLDESLVLPSKTLKQLDRPIRLYFEKTIV